VYIDGEVMMSLKRGCYVHSIWLSRTQEKKTLDRRRRWWWWWWWSWWASESVTSVCLCDDLISKLSFRQVYYRTQQYMLDQHFTLDNLCSSAVVVVVIVVVVVVVINTDKSLSAITAEFNTWSEKFKSVAESGESTSKYYYKYSSVPLLLQWSQNTV